MTLRVLYVNHTAAVSGGEHSLLELLSALPRSRVTPILACPPGDLADRARAAGCEVLPVRGMTGSLRLHPGHTPRAIVDLIVFAGQLRWLARRTHADIVHANSIRAGLAAAFCSGLGGPPSIVWIRDCLPDSPATQAVRRVIDAQASAIVFNSSYTGERFGPVSTPSAAIASPIDLKRFDPDALTRADARLSLGIDDEAPVLAVVAQITPWKGQDTAIRALGRLRSTWPSALLLLVGEAKFTAPGTRFDNLAFLRSLHTEIAALGLAEQVRFLGDRDDVPTVLRAADVVLVPSWEEPFGRVVVEAMAMETPVVATAVGGPADVIEDERTGRLAPPGDDARWAEVVGELLGNAPRRRDMGLAARAAAQAYGREAHAERVMRVYQESMGAGVSGDPAPDPLNAIRGV